MEIKLIKMHPSAREEETGLVVVDSSKSMQEPVGTLVSGCLSVSEMFTYWVACPGYSQVTEWLVRGAPVCTTLSQCALYVHMYDGTALGPCGLTW